MVNFIGVTVCTSRSLQDGGIVDTEDTEEAHAKLEERLNKTIAKLQDELFERTSKRQRDELLIRR